jgi:hypothetical protein
VVTPDPLTRPSLDELVLTPEGFAELPLGSSPGSFDPAMSIIEYVDLDCGDGAIASGWQAVESDPNTGFGSFGIGLLEDGSVSSIQVFSNLISTDHGIVERMYSRPIRVSKSWGQMIASMSTSLRPHPAGCECR